MSTFCAKCGFPQSGSTAFCSHCGSAVASAAPPMTPPASASGLKIVLAIVACLGVAGIAAMAGLYYLGHRVKEAVVHQAAANGVDLTSITNPASSSPRAPAVKVRPVCDYLPKDEASKIIGEPIERAVVKDSMCVYYGPPGLSAELARAKLSNTVQRAGKGNGPINVSDFESIEQIARDAGLGGDSSGEKESPLLMIGVEPDGGPKMTAIAASNAIFSGIFQAADAKGATFGQQLHLGDKAVRLPKLGLNVLRGDILVRVIPGPISDGDNKSIEIARLLLGRI